MDRAAHPAIKQRRNSRHGMVPEPARGLQSSQEGSSIGGAQLSYVRRETAEKSAQKDRVMQNPQLSFGTVLQACQTVRGAWGAAL